MHPCASSPLSCRADRHRPLSAVRAPSDRRGIHLPYKIFRKNSSVTNLLVQWKNSSVTNLPDKIFRNKSSGRSLPYQTFRKSSPRRNILAGLAELPSVALQVSSLLQLAILSQHHQWPRAAVACVPDARLKSQRSRFSGCGTKGVEQSVEPSVEQSVEQRVE